MFILEVAYIFEGIYIVRIMLQKICRAISRHLQNVDTTL